MAGAQRDDVTAVLVHGGFLGPWIWEDVVRLLAERGIPAVCPDLPSCRDTGALADLHDDAQAVRTVLDGCRDVVLCGHSYAGLVVSQAAAGPHKAVRHLVYLAAAIPDVGDSLASLAQAGLPRSDAPAGESGAEEVDVRADGRLVLRPDAARAGLFHDCAADRADAVIASLRPHSQVTAVHGTGRLEALTIRDTTTGTAETLPTAALFILIGAEPHTSWLATAVQRDQHGFVLTGRDLLHDHRPPPSWPLERPPLPLETSLPGVFAAGDVRHGSIKRVASAVGEGATAIQLAGQYLDDASTAGP